MPVSPDQTRAFVTAAVTMCLGDLSPQATQASLKIPLITAVLARLSVSEFSEFDSTTTTNNNNNFSPEQQDRFTRYQILCNKIRQQQPQHQLLPLPFLSLSPRLLLLSSADYFSIYNKICQTQADELFSDVLFINEHKSVENKSLNTHVADDNRRKKKKKMKKLNKLKSQNNPPGVRDSSLDDALALCEVRSRRDVTQSETKTLTQTQTLDELLSVRWETAATETKLIINSSETESSDHNHKPSVKEMSSRETPAAGEEDVSERSDRNAGAGAWTGAGVEVPASASVSVSVSEEWQHVAKHAKKKHLKQHQQQQLKQQQQQRQKKVFSSTDDDNHGGMPSKTFVDASVSTTDPSTSISFNTSNNNSSKDAITNRNHSTDTDDVTKATIDKFEEEQSALSSGGGGGGEANVYTSGEAIIIPADEDGGDDNNDNTRRRQGGAVIMHDTHQPVTMSDIEATLSSLLAKHRHHQHDSGAAMSGSGAGSSSASCQCGASLLDSLANSMTTNDPCIAQQQQRALLLPSSSSSSSPSLSAASTLSYCSLALDQLLSQHSRCLQQVQIQHEKDTSRLRESHDQAIHTGNLRLFIANNTLSTEREDRNKLVEAAVAEYIRTNNSSTSNSDS